MSKYPRFVIFQISVFFSDLSNLTAESKALTSFFLVQIVAGNAKKVTAARFRRKSDNHEEVIKVTRKAPKLIKRKQSSDYSLDGAKC